ncbi:MAG: alpha-1,2-fucosyltransferase [Clostridia bacterium]|nr:alpha-1,2-fucosyltransferase [Clostridia bacterium]
MVRVKIFNGLGNQLFQYACGRAVQQKYKGEFYLDISDFTVNKRRYRLNQFKLNENVKTIEKDNTFANIRKNLLLNGLYKIIPNIAFSIHSKFGKYLYFGEEYKKINKNFTNDYYLYGYWQSEKYFEDIKSILKQELTLKNPLEESKINLIQEIEHKNSVAIHIRRGDYVTNKLYQNICEESYYKKAITIMKEKVDNPVFYIFSDEIDWVKENWKFKGNIIFMNYANKDFEELEIMKHCKHFIIANSSFSWWAQYLSDNPKKIVVAPKKWYNHDKKVDIYQKNWITI